MVTVLRRAFPRIASQVIAELDMLGRMLCMLRRSNL